MANLRGPGPYELYSRHWLLVLFAVVVQAIVFLGWLVPFALPRVEAWQAAAFLLFFGSFL